MKKVTKIALTAIIATLLPLMSCDSSGNPSALVGRWVRVPDGGLVIELLGDGTGIFGQGTSITWKTENERIYITSNGTTSFNYKVKGSILTLTTDDGIGEYTKCHKECGEAVNEYIKKKFAEVKKSFGSFDDARDGKTYKTVKLENQTWMAENLNYEAEGSKCYGNNESNCQKYGRLYNWGTAMGACPKGWHLPNGDEWQILVDFAGGDMLAGKVLKAANGWDYYNSNGTDAFNFSALPGGYGYSDGSFHVVGCDGKWWSASEGRNGAYYRGMSCLIGDYAKWDSSPGSLYLYSVRCLQDVTAEQTAVTAQAAAAAAAAAKAAENARLEQARQDSIAAEAEAKWIQDSIDAAAVMGKKRF